MTAACLALALAASAPEPVTELGFPPGRIAAEVGAMTLVGAGTLVGFSFARQNRCGDDGACVLSFLVFQLGAAALLVPAAGLGVNRLFGGKGTYGPAFAAYLVSSLIWPVVAALFGARLVPSAAAQGPLFFAIGALAHAVPPAAAVLELGNLRKEPEVAVVPLAFRGGAGAGLTLRF